MNIEQIDPTKELNQEEFCVLFNQLPLNDQEKKEVKETYWQIYKVCLEHPEVDPTKAWLATKNTFIAQETQVGERMQELKENQK